MLHNEKLLHQTITKKATVEKEASWISKTDLNYKKK